MSEQYLYKEQHKYKTKSEPLHVDGDGKYCTFCGAAMDDDERFCPECGNPRSGIPCPACGTLNFRSFCSHCNTPLNEMAREAVRKAKLDPRFQRVQQLAAEMAELEGQIMAANEEQGHGQERNLDTSSCLSADERDVINRYASLFSGIGDLAVPDSPKEKTGQVKTREREKFTLGGDGLKAAVAEYRAKAKELQAQLDAMLPEPAATPEEQRNFFCARKVTTIQMRAVKQQWVCNYCGCYHNQPSECVQPELGGRWIMVKQPTPVTNILYD